MSRQFNTDGLMVFPPDNGEPITSNAFESIECAIAFDVRDWGADRRSAWIYAIVFGWDYEDSWDETAKKFGWDEEDRKRAIMMHEQWIKAKETKEQGPIPCGEKIKAGDVMLDFYECGYCKNAIRKPWKYCPFCGKEVEWKWV